MKVIRIVMGSMSVRYFSALSEDDGDGKGDSEHSRLG